MLATRGLLGHDPVVMQEPTSTGVPSQKQELPPARQGSLLLLLRSRRLLLRRLGVGDLEGFLAYRGDPEVARFQGWEAFSREQALAFLQRQEGQVPGVPGEWLQIGIVVQETQELVGDCALKLHAAAIVCLTTSGKTAQIIASFRPKAELAAIEAGVLKCS